MLTMVTETKGSAAYVALEIVSGTLGGHNGTFVFQHSAYTDRGHPHLTVSIAPAGTGELRGIRESMNFHVAAGRQHFYDFDYQLAVTS